MHPPPHPRLCIPFLLPDHGIPQEEIDAAFAVGRKILDAVSWLLHVLQGALGACTRQQEGWGRPGTAFQPDLQSFPPVPPSGG